MFLIDFFVRGAVKIEQNYHVKMVNLIFFTLIAVKKREEDRNGAVDKGWGKVIYSTISNSTSVFQSDRNYVVP